MHRVKHVSLEDEKKRNPELKDSDIQMLKDWCEKQPHLPKMPDHYYALFLHSNYYRMEPTKTTIENFFTCRTHVPEIFCNRDPLGSAELRKAFQVVANLPLNACTKEGYSIMFGKLLVTDPSQYNFFECTKFFFMVADLWVLSQGTSNGFVYVADVTGVSIGHVGRLSLMGLKKLLFYIQEAAPVRLMGVHFMNTVPVMETIMNMAKPFIKKELMDIIHFHTDLKSLAKFIPIETLPNELGGKAGPLRQLHEEQLKLIDEHRDWYIQEEATFRVNESLRVGKQKSATDLFGIEGSFRKLDID